MTSLRVRVALAAAVAVVAGVAALGIAAQWVVEHELRSSQDRGLRGRATEVSRLAVSAPALLTSTAALDAPFGGQELLVQVVDRERRIVARSSALGGRLLGANELVRAAIGGGRSDYGELELSGEPLRVFVAPLPDAAGVAGGGAVIVASSVQEIQHTSDRVRRLMLMLGVAAAAVGALAAALLTGRGLAPLRRLTTAAQGIERTGDAARRLPAAGGGEIGQLTETLNAMLAALERARHSERRFLADASHELRTPVTSLRGNVEYMARHGADPEALEDVRADTERLARLIDDLLVLERQAESPHARGPVSLDALARAAAALDPRVRSDAPEPVAADGDEEALRRAVENLVANALTHGEGTVSVTARLEGARARLTVADEGPGLDPGAAESAFERFWRGSEARGRPGSGLGLAIVRAIARAHGGDVEVAGAAFTIDLPAATGPQILRDSSEPGRSVDLPLPRGPS